MAIARLFDDSSNSSHISSPIKTPLKVDHAGHDLETIQSQDMSSKATPHLQVSPGALPQSNKMTFACAQQVSSHKETIMTNEDFTLQNMTNKTSEYQKDRLSKQTEIASTANQGQSTRQPTAMAIEENGNIVFDHSRNYRANDENKFMSFEPKRPKKSGSKKSSGSKRGSQAS